MSARKNREAFTYLFAKFWKFGRGERARILLFSLGEGAATSVLLSGPLIFGRIIREIEQNGLTAETVPFILGLLALLFATNLVFWIFHGPARVLERLVAFRIALRYRKYLLDGVLNLDLNWHNDHDSGNTIHRIQKAAEGLQEFGGNLFQVTQTSVRLVGTTAAVLFFSPSVSFSVFVLVLVSLRVIYSFDMRMLPQFVGLNEFANKASASFFDALSNVTTVKILHIEQPVSTGVNTRFADAFPLYRRNAVVNEFKWFSGIMLFQGICIFPLGGYVFYKVKMGQPIDAGNVSTLYLYLSELMWVYFTFGSFYELLCTYRNNVINAEPIEETIAESRQVDRQAVEPFRDLSIHDLEFSYGASASGFKAFTTKIRKGEKIAIIGESGSGKTTFLKLVHGMYPAGKAVLQMDENAPFETKLADLDFGTMLVPQDPELFSSSIRENLTLGIAYDEEKILDAIKVARFDAVLASLPKGLDSVINEKGVNLSGGQKQRLALARAILFSENKDVLLLDESTSSVDSENEVAIYKNIFELFEGRTVLASIHKMNLLKFFDRILIFDKFKIADEGSFDELLARNASFRNAWQQFVSREG